MKLIYKLTLLLSLTFSSYLSAYSYAAAGKELTIDAKELILKHINEDNFKSADKSFEKYKENYKYLNDNFIDGLYDRLNIALENKDKKEIIRSLELSIAAEILRRIDGGHKNIENFNVAKVMLAKANKFYKLLSVSLDKDTDKKLKSAIKACMIAIGNPGLFGVGAKKADKQLYITNEKVIKEILQSL
ncbi:hypothetical protein [Sulfurimonas sp.]|uniref:hypothetical protein n=1 Tax=Sulfurimonas sp. TaxID=2022749 RepID=UPI0025E5F668|nr:hypothetical protein [Sulfurimonas sp.]